MPMGYGGSHWLHTDRYDSRSGQYQYERSTLFVVLLIRPGASHCGSAGHWITERHSFRVLKINIIQETDDGFR